MGGEGKKKEMPDCGSCKCAGLCSTRCPPLYPPLLRAPSCSAQTHSEADASSAALPAFYTAAVSCTWLLGLAGELEEEAAAVVGNAAERRKRVVYSRDTEHDLELPHGTR